MGFLDAEPALADAPITIVCESYGGKMGVALAKELLGLKADKKLKASPTAPVCVCVCVRAVEAQHGAQECCAWGGR